MSIASSGRTSSCWLRCSCDRRCSAAGSSPSGSSTSQPLRSVRFQRRCPTRTAATTGLRTSGWAARAAICGSAAAGAPTPTTRGSCAKASASLPFMPWSATRAPLRSISTNRPWFCHTANGRRSVICTTTVPGRRRSTVACSTKVSWSMRLRAASTEKPSMSSPTLTPSACCSAASGVMSRPDTVMVDTRIATLRPSSLRSGAKEASLRIRWDRCSAPPTPATTTIDHSAGRSSRRCRLAKMPTRDGRSISPPARVGCFTRGMRRSPPSRRTRRQSRRRGGRPAREAGR